MGRFYQGSKARFSNNMFALPVDNMFKVMAMKEAQTDATLKTTELLEGAVDSIQHLNFEADNERLKSIQDKYNAQINEVTDRILENPHDASKYQPYLRKLQKDFHRNKTSGELSKIEARGKDFAKWGEENKKIKETDPMLFNRMQNKFYDDLVQKASYNPDAAFKGSPIVSRPDLSSDETRKRFKEIKANFDEYLTEDGLYKVGEEILSEAEVSEIAMSELFSDPQYKAYAHQMGSVLGDSGYLGEDGEMLPLMVSDDKGRQVLNKQHAFYNDVNSLAKTYGFSKRTLDSAPKLNIPKTPSMRKTSATGIPMTSQELGESLIFSVPEYITTPEEQKGLLTEWRNLYQSNLAGNKVNSLRLAELNEVFEPIIRMEGKNILKAFGDNPAVYKSESALQNRVMEHLTNMNKLDDDKWEIDESVKWHGNTSSPEYTPTAKRRHTQAVQDYLNDTYDNYSEFLAKGLKQQTVYKSFGKDKTTDALIDKLDTHNNYFNPSVRKAGSGLYDFRGQKTGVEGNIRNLDWINSDVDNIFKHLMAVTGASSIRELIDEGYIKGSHTPSGKNEVTALWTLTDKVDDFDLALGDDEVNTFKTTHSGIDLKGVYEKSNNPEDNKLNLIAQYAGQDGKNSYLSLSQKMDYIESLQKKDPTKYNEYYPDGYPIKVETLPNVSFKFKYTKQGVKLIAESLRTGEKEIIEQSYAEFKGHKPEDVIKMYLLDSVHKDQDIIKLNQ